MTLPVAQSHLTPVQRDRRAFARAMRDAGHTLEEIGGALGVTRERVRQYLVGDTSTRGVTSRVEGFVNVDPVKLAAAYQRTNSVGSAARESGCSTKAAARALRELGLWSPGGHWREHRQRRHAEIVEIVRTLARELGRTPIAKEIGWRLCPVAANDNTAQVRAHQDGRRYFGSYAAMIRAAGCEPRGKGGKGHRRRVRVTCKKGLHPLIGENLYLYRKPDGTPVRICRACAKAWRTASRSDAPKTQSPNEHSDTRDGAQS